MKLKIREAIALAKNGATREELITHFGLSESEYKKEFATFSEKTEKS